jgi:hypothetical protein
MDGLAGEDVIGNAGLQDAAPKEEEYQSTSHPSTIPARSNQASSLKSYDGDPKDLKFLFFAFFMLSGSRGFPFNFIIFVM